MSGCGTTVKIPDVRIYKEIPFQDAPEGVYKTTTSNQKGIVTAPAWALIRPYLVCIDSDDWMKIEKTWEEACRYAGKHCNETPKSISDMIKQLDDIARIVLGGVQP